MRDSFETFREEMAQAMLFPRKAWLRKYCARQALAQHGPQALYAEFGVWRGHGVNLFARMLEAPAARSPALTVSKGSRRIGPAMPRAARPGATISTGSCPRCGAT